jgi:hypothetical protein
VRNISQRHSKLKELAEYHQIEDKIYAFLGDLGNTLDGKGQMNEYPEEEQSNDAAEDRLGNYNNYLVNNVIRMPFEP